MRLPLDADSRKCTDIPFCLLFTAFWAGMLYIAAVAVQGVGPEGYQRLTNGEDFNGLVCGVSAGVQGKPYLFWLDPVGAPDLTWCMGACPSSDSGSVTVLLNGKNQSYALYKTTTVFRYCMPQQNSVNASAVSAALSKVGLAHVVADLGVSWPVLLASAGIAVVAGFLYLFVLRHTVGCAVYVLILLIVAGLGFGGYLMWSHGKSLDDGAAGKDAMVWGGIGCVVADLIFILLVCALRKSIVLAVAILKEATKAVRDLKSLLFVPVAKFLVVVLLFVYWIAVAVYLAANGKPGQVMVHVPGIDQNIPVKKMQWDSKVEEYGVAHFFGLLWGMAFIVAVGDMIIAGAVGQWYFTRESNGEKELHSPVWRSVHRTLRFHLGTAAFGSFVLALVGLIKWIMRYVTKKVRDASGDSKIVKVFVCMCMCCVRCFERCIAFLDRHAYIETALFGHSFCAASRSSFQLFARNAGRVASLTTIGAVFLLLGRLLIAAVTGVSTFLICKAVYGEQLSSPIMPTAVASLVGWVVGSIFSQVYSMASDTLLHAYVADIEASSTGSEARPRYASASLQRAVNTK